MKDAFVSSQHPDVLSGKRTAEAVRLELLDTFDFGGEKAGKVSREEFTDYRGGNLCSFFIFFSFPRTL